MTFIFFIIINPLISLIYKPIIFFLSEITILLKKKISLKKIKFIIKEYKRLSFIYNFKFNEGIIKTNNIIIIFI
jgi:hypothetical protein